MDFLLLSLVLLPLLGAAVIALLPSASAARRLALLVSLLTLGLGVALACQFYALPDQVNLAKGPNYRINVSPEFIQGTTIQAIGFSVSAGVDAISVALVLLTVFLTPLAVAASFQSIQDRAKEYYAWMIMLLAAMNGVFIARDALLFYIFFELTLIPMFFIIGIWGGPERRYAAGKFFLFTFAGSVFTLAGIIYLAVRAGGGGQLSFDIHHLVAFAQRPAGLGLSDVERFWITLGLLAGFAVKVPLFPVHTWLPLAHTEAPTAGSVILAGVLLKLGTYGLMRIALPIGLASKTAVMSLGLLQALAGLCLIGIIYGALVAWVQQDIKKLVAYSSVSHLGFCVLGLVALNDHGMQGSVLYMINHGLSTGAMFLVIGMIYDRYHTRDLEQLSGLAKKMPKLAFFFVLFVLASIGLPGLNGFVSEFLTILGAFTSQFLGWEYGVVAAVGIVLGAVYMLHMTAKVIWGPLKVPALHGHDSANHGAAPSDDHGHHKAQDDGVKDIGAREIAILVPLALAVILLGVLPNLVLKPIARPIQDMHPPEVQVWQAAPAAPHARASNPGH